jgi:hypothetical protein
MEVKRLICATLLALFPIAQSYSQPRSVTRPDRVTIFPKQIKIVRTGKFARDVPSRRIATIRYPFVAGLPDKTILRKVRSLLYFENIFDTTLQEYREWNSLDTFDYVVNFNGNYILDVTFTQSGQAAEPYFTSKSIPVFLKTGAVLKANDVFNIDRLAELAHAVDEKLQNELTELIQSAKLHQDGASIVDALNDMKFDVKNLDDFSVSKDGISFLYDSGFPHAHWAFNPKGRYLFPYSTLQSFIKPTGPLAPFLKR